MIEIFEWENPLHDYDQYIVFNNKKLLFSIKTTGEIRKDNGGWQWEYSQMGTIRWKPVEKSKLDEIKAKYL